jgi:AcrR family transcriptional regulator
LTSRRRSPQQERSRATVDSIVDAAAALLAESNAHDITTTRIAEAAACSVAGLYRFFPNREAVFVELGDRYRAKLGAMYEELLTVPPTRAPNLIAREVFDRLVEFIRNEPGFRSLWWSGLIDARTIGPDRRDGLVLIAEGFHGIYEPESDPASRPAANYLVLVEAADHLIGVAFRDTPTGDQAILDATVRLLTLQLASISDRVTISR